MKYWNRFIDFINRPTVTSLGPRQHPPLWQSVLYDYLGLIVFVASLGFCRINFRIAPNRPEFD